MSTLSALRNLIRELAELCPERLRMDGDWEVVLDGERYELYYDRDELFYALASALRDHLNKQCT